MSHVWGSDILEWMQFGANLNDNPDVKCVSMECHFSAFVGTRKNLMKQFPFNNLKGWNITQVGTHSISEQGQILFSLTWRNRALRVPFSLI